MASSSFIADPEEHKWVIEIDEIINHQLEVDDDETPSVSLFHVPQTITKNKPEAYEPQQIGVGPMHHFRSLPYKKMEQKKLAVMRDVLKEYGIEDYKLHVLNEVRKLVPKVRSCYDMFLPHEDDYLATIFAIDGLFLLNLFHTYNNSPVEEEEEEEEEDLDEYPRQKDLPKVGPKKRFVAQDILMVENQIPMMVLKEIYETNLHASSGNFSPSIFRIFCEIHSPLKLCSKSLAPSTTDHLLQYMYYSIVNNVYRGPDDKKEEPEDVHKCDLCLWRRGRQRMEPVKLAYEFITNIPREEIAQAYEQTISVLETFCQTKFLIPSASNLRDKAGFRFYSLPEDQGIPNIHVWGKDIYLPKITLNNDSEVILRNLVAYETLMANPDSTSPLNEYMGFMCGLIVNKEDADYLKSQNVIVGDLDANEVVKLFTGISSSIQTAKNEGEYYSILRETMDEINKVYESGVRIKTYLLFKKLAGWLLEVLRAIGGLVESTWKVVAFIVSIVAVLLLILQAYCDVYGCK